MTLEEPDDKTKAAADWDALRALGNEALELGMAGKMTPAKFDELWARGLEASGHHPELLEALERWRP